MKISKHFKDREEVELRWREKLSKKEALRKKAQRRRQKRNHDDQWG